MPALRPCELVYGNTFYSVLNPLAVAFDHVTVIPTDPLTNIDNDPTWGVYGPDGKNISLAAYRRGPHQDRVGQSQHMEFGQRAWVPADGCTRIYVGVQMSHHGHFLLTSLARFWPLLRLTDRNFKLIYHGNYDIETVCRHVPVAAAALEAFGLTPDHFVRPMEQTCFEQLYIPAPSFEETNSSHRVHGEVGEKIGSFLKQGRTLRSFSNPVMFSKAKLVSGVGRIANEHEIADCLARKGVEILHPEDLPLVEQIEVFDAAPAVISYAGSALHTSLLAANPTTIIGLGANSSVVSSHILIDTIKGNDAAYFYPAHIRASGAGSTFAAEYRVDDPPGVADAIMRRVDAMTGWRARLRRAARRGDPLRGLDFPGAQSVWP